MGYAAVVSTGADQHPYLLHSADGIQWRTTDLVTVGASRSPISYVQGVVVGGHHIDVTLGSGETPATPTTIAKVVTLVATPKA